MNFYKGQKLHISVAGFDGSYKLDIIDIKEFGNEKIVYYKWEFIMDGEKNEWGFGDKEMRVLDGFVKDGIWIVLGSYNMTLPEDLFKMDS